MNFRQLVQDYFTFSRNERKGITIVLVIVFILAVGNKIIFYFETPAKIETQLLDFQKKDGTLLAGDSITATKKEKKLFSFNPNTIEAEALDSLLLPEGIKKNMLKYRDKGGRYYNGNDFRKMYGVTDSIYGQVASLLVFESKTARPVQEKKQSELFAFDPNTSTDSDFLRLGLSEKQIQGIRNYQAKGGSFRKGEDFMKIYSLSAAQKNALAPFIEIKEKERGGAEKEKVAVDLHIDINVADSLELMKLPGIGTKLSKRIVKYRDLLGGFYSMDQLNEVYGLSEQTIDQIKGMLLVDSSKIRKMDVNFADWNELSRHPYIQKTLAREIVKFRTKYGSINETSVLKDSMILNPEQYLRLRPYL